MELFPILTTIDPVLAAIEGMSEIGVREDPINGVGYVMYQVAFAETFADPLLADTPEEALRRRILRECRGIKFDLKTREIVSRPYHKFFNIAEKAETQPNMIDWDRPHIILEKLDGSMLTPLLVRSEDGPKWGTDPVVWMTKRGVTGVADTALQFLADNPNYETFCRDQMSIGLTPIFEWCTRKQRIILDYGPVDRMVLTGIRKNLTGEYLSQLELESLGVVYNLDVVKPLNLSANNIQDFMRETYALEGAEGYIVVFENGERYKIKGEWYCRIHSTFDNLRFEKDVIRLILSEEVDDAMPFMVPTLVSSVERFQTDMHVALLDQAENLFIGVAEAKERLNGVKRDFAEFLNTNPGSWSSYKGIMFWIWDKNPDMAEIYEHLIAQMISATGTQTNVDKSRHLIGGLRWNDYLTKDEPVE